MSILFIVSARVSYLNSFSAQIPCSNNVSIMITTDNNHMVGSVLTEANQATAKPTFLSLRLVRVSVTS
jgi:hypothetical protein